MQNQISKILALVQFFLVPLVYFKYFVHLVYKIFVAVLLLSLPLFLIEKIFRAITGNGNSYTLT